ncbi:MAG: DMT family transporter [Actinobacteria bacterium]|nr:DMT family transporter [Actinomycetota bacterium]
MSRYWPMLFLLAAIWGASYVCIKVAVEDIEPAPMMAIRALGAGLLLLGFLAVTTGRAHAVRELARHWRPALVLGTVNAAIPFWLIAWGEKHIDSSVAGIAQATVPIFTFLLAARFSAPRTGREDEDRRGRDRFRRRRGAGRIRSRRKLARGRGDTGRRSLVALLRLGRGIRATQRANGSRPGTGDRLDARGRVDPPAFRPVSAADARP